MGGGFCWKVGINEYPRSSFRSESPVNFDMKSKNARQTFSTGSESQRYRTHRGFGFAISVYHFLTKIYIGNLPDEGKEPTSLRSAMELLMHALLHNLVFTPVVIFSSKYLHTATFLKN